MSFHDSAIKEIYDKSPFAFCVVQVLTDKSDVVQDMVVSYANQAFSDMIGKPTEMVAGTSFYEKTRLLAPKWLSFCKDTAFAGKANTATQYNPKTGKYILMQCYQIAYGYCGCLITDVTEQKRQHEQARAGLETQRIIVSCAQNLVSSPNFEESVSHVLKSILNYFQSARSYIFKMDRDKQIAVNSHEQCADGVSPQMQNLSAVPFSAINAWIKSFESDRYIHIQDVSELKNLPGRRAEYETLTAQGIHSLLAVPYSFDGKLQGFIGVDDPKVHVDEIGFLTDLTYFISVEMAKYRLGQRLHAEEEKFRIATENSDVSFWTYDYAHHAILQTNSSHAQHGFEMIVDNVPESLISCGHIRKDSQQAFMEMYRQLESGVKTAGGDFWTLNSKTNQWWCQRINYTNVFDVNGKPVRAYAMGRDVTAEIQQKIDRTKLDVALSSSNLYIWEYDIVEKRSIQQEKAVKDYGVEQVLENVPESIIEKGLIHPDSIEAYREIHAAVCRGEKSATAEICYINPDKTINWLRCTYTTIFSDGKPVSAIGCSVDINAVKEMERKFKDEFAYIEAAQSDDLLVKVRTNVTKGIVESYAAKDVVGISADNTPYDIGVEQLAATGFTQKEQGLIRSYLNRERVLKAFVKGETSYTLDYRRKIHDGSVIWVNTTVKTYQNPETGDVMSFMYTYNINEEKIKDRIIETVTSLEYDYIAYINLKSEEFRLYTDDKQTSRILPTKTKSYIQSVYDVNRAVVVPEDVERAISDMLPDGIRKNLSEHRIFSAVYSVYDENHNIRKKRVQYAYLNKENEQIVCTRTDITDLFKEQQQQQDMLEAALLAAKQTVPRLTSSRV